jgi:thioredoxin-like negative regulator of GroEL
VNALKKKKNASGESANYTAAQLLEKAEELIDTCDYDLARRFLERALQQEPENGDVLTVLGDLLLHTGHFEEAAQVLRRLAPLVRTLTNAC